jgi:hypothetical protein
MIASSLVFLWTPDTRKQPLVSIEMLQAVTVDLNQEPLNVSFVYLFLDILINSAIYFLSISLLIHD